MKLILQKVHVINTLKTRAITLGPSCQNKVSIIAQPLDILGLFTQ